VKRFTLLTLCLGFLVSSTANVQTAEAQSGASQAKKAVGLIDMAYLFKEYNKFADLRSQLRNEIKSSDDQARQLAEKIKSMQQVLKSGELEPGSPDQQKVENQLINEQTKFEAYRKTQQVEFLRRESKIYKEVYLEVVEAVAQYASYYKYDVILRFSREGVGETNNAQELIQNMNRQVVWHSEGIDITKPVLQYLNQKYGERKTAEGDSGTTTK